MEKTFWKYGQSSKNITDADSADENKKSNANRVPTSFEMKNLMKSMYSYLDAFPNGEMNNKMEDMERFEDKKYNTKKSITSYS
ncbi:hypothetical protein TNCV_1458471 [Trichonephila clavipes]|nr:hypothetical protein TNCV_1458471 [Trichonephila clavipes]